MAGRTLAFLIFAVWTVAVQSIPTTTSTAAVVEDVRRQEFEQDRNGAASRIVAGWSAVDGQIPHQVSLRMISNAGAVSSCGGSVIHHHWVLTAAHCVANRFSFVIRIGLTNLTRTNNIIESSRRYIHPGYWEPSAGVQTDDIALLGVDHQRIFSPTARSHSSSAFIQPCRLQPSSVMDVDYTGVTLTASGYGMTEDSWNGGAVSETLNWVYLRGISNDLCLQYYPTASEIIKNPTICAEYYNDTRQSSCQGDSGGPLTYMDFDGRPTMVGVASFVSSAGCNSVFPSGWVRPGHYHSWYRQITGLNFDWTISSDGTVIYNVEFADPGPMRPITFGPQDFGPLRPSL